MTVVLFVSILSVEHPYRCWFLFYWCQRHCVFDRRCNSQWASFILCFILLHAAERLSLCGYRDCPCVRTCVCMGTCVRAYVQERERDRDRRGEGIRYLLCHNTMGPQKHTILAHRIYYKQNFCIQLIFIFSFFFFSLDQWFFCCCYFFIWYKRILVLNTFGKCANFFPCFNRMVHVNSNMLVVVMAAVQHYTIDVVMWMAHISAVTVPVNQCSHSWSHPLVEGLFFLLPENRWQLPSSYGIGLHMIIHKQTRACTHTHTHTYYTFKNKALLIYAVLVP